jgi:hypothetical protein
MFLTHFSESGGGGAEQANEHDEFDDGCWIWIDHLEK